MVKSKKARSVARSVRPSKPASETRASKSAYPLLSAVRSPADLKRIPVARLPEVAAEVRHKLLETCAKNGGHIGTNLGVVELSLALHHVFDFSRDRLVLDTSHQSYTHKLVTGRFASFDTICTPQGIPRFTVRGETPYDHWSAGHASTALSGAMGMAEARDQRKQRFDVITIFGDGALTGGMCYEALNNIGYNQTDIIMVLNDNKMSISPNVGAMFEYLKRLSDVIAGGRREIGTIFEKLGIKYFGPVNGHDPAALVNTFQELREIRGPKLVHVLTEKGKGMPYMEEDAARWHEHAAFDRRTGEPLGAKKPKIESIAADTVIEIAKRDPAIVAITAAMPAGTGLAKFGETYPKRFYDVGIAEEHAVTFAAGLAAEGVKPYVSIYSPFLQRGFDQMAHDVAMQDLPVRFLVPKAAITPDGPTQGGILDLSYLRIIPRMVVAAPKNEAEMRAFIKFSAAYEKGPFAIRFPKGGASADLDTQKEPEIAFGKGEVLKKGTDISLIAAGFMVRESMEAAALLQKEGISAEVLNARFVKPLDEKLVLSSLKKTGCALTVEENTCVGGFGSGVLELIEEQNISDIPVHRVAARDDFIGYDLPKNIKREWGMDGAGIAKRAKATVAQKRGK